MRFGCLGAVAGVLLGTYVFYLAVLAGPNGEPPGVGLVLKQLIKDLSEGGGGAAFVIFMLMIFGIVVGLPVGLMAGVMGWFSPRDKTG